MASSSNPSKRVKTLGRGPRQVDNIGRLEAWFACGNKEERDKCINAYITTYNKKIVNIPKFVHLEWLEEQQLHCVCELLEFQGLKRFLGLTLTYIQIWPKCSSPT